MPGQIVADVICEQVIGCIFGRNVILATGEHGR